MGPTGSLHRIEKRRSTRRGRRPMRYHAAFYRTRFDRGATDGEVPGETASGAHGGWLSGLTILIRIIIENGEAKLRIVQCPLGQVQETASMISRDREMRELTGEIRREYGVS
jgi:hypothetical protein